MSVRQYIGARYVPRFTGPYDPTQQYEALDVVDNGAGTTYIARKTVPAGTPLTNNEFWFIYGASSGAIIQLQNDVVELRNTKVDALSKRSFLILSDRYDNSDDTSWSEIISDHLDLTAQVVSDDAASFAGSTKWRTLLSNATISNPDSITDVLIVGGINDVGETSEDILTEIEALDAQIKTLCPNVQRIHLGYVAWHSYSNDLAGRANYINTRGYYNTGAHRVGWAFIPNIYYVLTRPLYILNAEAVTSFGVGAIASALEDYLLTGHCDVIWTCTTEMRQADEVSLSVSDESGYFNIIFSCRNGRVDVSLPSMTATFLSNVTSGFKELFEIANTFECPWYPLVTFACISRDKNSSWYLGGISFDEGSIKVRSNGAQISNTELYAFSSLSIWFTFD